MKGLSIVLLILGMWFISGVNGESYMDLAWENIGRELVEVNAVWVDSRDSRIILAGTNREIFKTEDGGNSWQAVLFGANKGVNFLYVDRINKNLVYAGCVSGLFFSRNQGKTWQRIYQGNSQLEANCLSLIKLKNKEVYLGTEAGLLRSQGNGRIWHRFPGRLGELPIRAIVADPTNRLIYLVTPEGVYQIKPQAGAGRIFFFQANGLREADEGIDEEFDEESEEEPGQQINHICIGPDKTQDIYLATSKGVFKSKDSGCSWERLPDFGLLSKEVHFIAILPDSVILAATKSGIFAYDKDRWREISLRLTMQDSRFLTIDNCGNIYVAGDKGLFRSAGLPKSIVYSSTGNNQEPTIQQIQQAAIKYAEVINPVQIAAHRRLSRLKAILPDFSLNYDKTIYGSATTKVNGTSYGNIITGPRNWSVSFKWSLSDLIWSEQQRLIDSQVRLMIKLRQDILDEVTRLYFERRRLQLELVSSGELKPKVKQDKELKIQELTALLDGLTGGYLSKKLRGKI